MSEIIKSIPPYERTTHYYETDRMGIIHHSNYIRWFEETRVYYLEKAGYPYGKMEENGILIPVLSAYCEYKNAIKFDETILIELDILEFNGFRMKIGYRVTGKDDGQLKATGATTHIFTSADLKPLRVKKEFPDVYNIFNDNKVQQAE